MNFLHSYTRPLKAVARVRIPSGLRQSNSPLTCEDADQGAVAVGGLDGGRGSYVGHEPAAATRQTRDVPRRAMLAAGLAAGATALAAPSHADVGSGTLGTWVGRSRSMSADSQWAACQRDGVWSFGDSIALADGRALAQLMYDQTGMAMAVDHWASRPTTPAVDALAARIKEWGVPRRLLMQVGTNDIFDPSVMSAQIARVLDMVALTDCEVVWVDVHVCRWRYPAATQIADMRNSGWVNAQLEAAAAPNLHLVRWSQFLAQSPSRIARRLTDGVHTNNPSTPCVPDPLNTGQGARNAMILAAVKDVA